MNSNDMGAMVGNAFPPKLETPEKVNSFVKNDINSEYFGLKRETWQRKLNGSDISEFRW